MRGSNLEQPSINIAVIKGFAVKVSAVTTWTLLQVISKKTLGSTDFIRNLKEIFISK